MADVRESIVADAGWGPSVLLCFALIATCGGEPKETGPSFVVRDSAGVRIAENGNPESGPACAVRGPAVTVGDGSGRPGHELYRVVGGRRLSDGRIVLVNQGSHEIRFYDEAGVYLDQAGREGQGPGEFRNAYYLWAASGDTLWIGDTSPWKFHVFSSSGEWVRTVRPIPPIRQSPALVTVLSDGRTILAARDVNVPMDFSTRRQVTAMVYASNGVVADTLKTFDYGVWGLIGDANPALIVYPLFESAPWLDGAGEVVHAGHSSEAEVMMFSGRPLSLSHLVRWDPGDRTVHSSDVAAQRELLHAQYSESNPDERRRLLEPLTSEERPVEDEFPAFNDIVTNRAGGFWVREYPRPDAPSPDHWLVFDSGGRMMCRAELPPSQVLDVGSDYVLVKRESDLGVEQVSLYEVTAVGT